MRGEQLLGAQHRERHEQLRADLVLPAFAVRRRHQRRAEALAVREVREHRVVLVIRMRRRHHEVADGVELAQREFERRLALQRGNRDELMLGGGMCGAHGEEDDEGEERFAHCLVT